MNKTEITYRNHSILIKSKDGFSWIYIDGKYTFRLKQGPLNNPENQAREIVDRLAAQTK